MAIANLYERPLAFREIKNVLKTQILVTFWNVHIETEQPPLSLIKLYATNNSNYLNILKKKLRSSSYIGFMCPCYLANLIPPPPEAQIQFYKSFFSPSLSFSFFKKTKHLKCLAGTSSSAINLSLTYGNIFLNKIK